MQCVFPVFGQNQKFKVVLDAGHGGKDYGAVYHGNIEKILPTNCKLRVGAIFRKDPQIDVVYTVNQMFYRITTTC